MFFAPGTAENQRISLDTEAIKMDRNHWENKHFEQNHTEDRNENSEEENAKTYLFCNIF